MNAKTKPRRLFRARRQPSPVIDHVQRFQAAMTEVVADDLQRSPCVCCAGPAVFTGMWSPTPECVARELGGDSGSTRTLIYRLCGACVDRAGRDRSFVATIEHAVLEVYRVGQVHRFKDGVSCI